MLKVCWWLQGRLFQLWHYVRDQTEQIEKIGPPPTHFYFCIFLLFFFVIFFSPVLRWHGPFFDFFLNFFVMFTNIGLPDIERRKRKRNLLLGQPQGSLSERIDTPCAYVNLQLTCLCRISMYFVCLCLCRISMYFVCLCRISMYFVLFMFM